MLWVIWAMPALSSSPGVGGKFGRGGARLDEADSDAICEHLLTQRLAKSVDAEFGEAVDVCNESQLKTYVDNSVMMVTALSPIIGYDKASVISHYAIDRNLTLKEAALANGVSEELYDRVVKPLALTQGASADLAAAAKRG